MIFGKGEEIFPVLDPEGIVVDGDDGQEKVDSIYASQGAGATLDVLWCFCGTAVLLVAHGCHRSEVGEWRVRVARQRLETGHGFGGAFDVALGVALGDAFGGTFEDSRVGGRLGGDFDCGHGVLLRGHAWRHVCFVPKCALEC